MRASLFSEEFWMPLDTQPLSRRRRALMLGVLVVLFVGSVAFAEFLVLRQKRPAEALVVSLDRFGFKGAEPERFTDEIMARSGVVAGHPREVMVFTFAMSPSASQQQIVDAAEDLFVGINGSPPSDSAMSTLAGATAVQVFGGDAAGHFTILRFAVIGNRAVAISYSGPGRYTDADKGVFEAICAKGIQVRQ